MTSTLNTFLKSAGLALLAAMALPAGQPANKNAGALEILNLRARTSLQQARAADSAGSQRDAEEAVQEALRIAPGDFEARKLEVKVLLARHRFREALERALPLNSSAPDDVEAWGLVSDAALGLGDYTEAEHSAQWMLNLRSTNVGGLERGARLRECFGDNDGAREFWESAMRLTLADDEQRAWLATQMASLSRRTGRAAQAEALLRQILGAIPNYQPAVAEMARVRIQQHQYAEATAMLQERYGR